MKNTGTAKLSEVILTGRCVSHGYAAGRVVCLYGRKRQYFRQQISDAEVPGELERIKKAISTAISQLEDLIEHPPSGSAADIFDAHLLMVESSSFSDAIVSQVSDSHKNAEWAVKTVADELKAQQRKVSNEDLRQRYQDIEDIAERVLNALADGRSQNPTLPPDTILVASEVTPSTLIEYWNSPPVAIVTEHGGWTSHTFILARELGIPAVAGIPRILRRLSTGDTAIIAADKGRIILNPTNGVANVGGSDIEPIETAARSAGLKGSAEHSVVLRVNLDNVAKYSAAVTNGAHGIGLLRSEYLFMGDKGWPDEDRQLAAYKRVAETVGDDGARIRTFDFGLEQVSFTGADQEKNPALGMRAIRLCLSREWQFRKQVRSIMAANERGNLSITLPMIAGVRELKASKAIIEEESLALKEKGIYHGIPKIGIMIELPSAVMTIDQLVRHSDFFCLGTNDLVQYTLGVDRDNETVADWYETLHPAILRSIEKVLVTARNAGVPAAVCGEVAGSPFYTPLLIGLGATELSIKRGSLRGVSYALSVVDQAIAGDIAHRCLDLETAKEIEELLTIEYSKHYPELLRAE